MGLTYRGTNIEDLESLYFEVRRGFWEPADVRGEDLVIPGKEGRTALNRIKDVRSVELWGWVRGRGVTRTERLEDWNTSTLALMALMDFTAAPGALQVSTPTMGLAAGVERTVQAVCRNAVAGDVRGQWSVPIQTWTFELEVISDPPDWVVT